jgi:hydroxymethylbilane synthase
VRIATRGSELALWQAHHVQALLLAAGVCDEVEIVIVSTSGDRDKVTPLHEIGGKGIFVKEVQAALLDGRADLAVHSAKDMPAISPDELTLGAVPVRGNPCDVLVGGLLAELPDGARIGTGSVRRRAQLAALRPDLTFDELRGNIPTRLEKADSFDAIVMACAALDRLGEEPEVVDMMSVEQMVPQAGQGALAIECRVADPVAIAGLAVISHPESLRMFECERSFLRELGGDCSLPAGAHAVLVGDTISLTGFLGSEDLRDSRQVSVTGTNGSELGTNLAIDLRARLG